MYIRITNPSQDTYTYENQLTKIVRETEFVLPVLQDSDPVGSYLIIGEPNNPRTEVVRPVSYSKHQIFLGSGLKEDHTQATNIYKAYYQNIEVYRIRNGVKSLFGTFPIEWNKPNTVIFDKNYQIDIDAGDKIEYSYKLVNSQNGNKTAEKQAYIGDETGFTYDAQKTSADELLRELNQKAFGNEGDKTRNPSEWLLDINYTISELSNEVIYPGHNEYFFTQAEITVITGKSNYILPPDFDAILDVRLNGCTIAPRSLTRQKQDCCQRCEVETCETPVDPCDKCPKPEEKKCETPCPSLCEKDYFYQITAEEVILDPVPEKDMTLSLSYYGLPRPFTSTSDRTVLPPGFREILVLGTLFRYFSFNDRTADGIAYAQYLQKNYNRQKEILLEKIFSRAKGRIPTQQRVYHGIRADDIFYPNQMSRFTRPSGYNSYIPKM